MTYTIIGVFESMDTAQRAAARLGEEGVNRERISIVGKGENAEVERRGVADERAEGEEGDLTIGKGAAVGGVTGLAVALTALAIPGVGPIVAAGPLMAALTGAGVGAVSGGILGPLIDLGISNDDAELYSNAVRAGRVLVTVEAEDEVRAEEAQRLLDENGAVEPAEGAPEEERREPLRRRAAERRAEQSRVQRDSADEACACRSRVVERPAGRSVPIDEEDRPTSSR